MSKDTMATQQQLDALSNRVSGIVDSLNEVNTKARKYVDECDEEQNKKLKAMEERLSKLIETKIENYDKLVRNVVVKEFAKIGK